VRFLLDNDVDIAVCALLKRNGHECWSAAAAGLAGDDAAEDDDISVYADEKGAVVITHDREFSLRRRRNTFGRHVWLRCLEPMAVEVLADHLDELVRRLEEMAVVVIEVRPDSLIVHPPAWK
jgi:predicted nuclease of predicted toxin-antitoxin system